MQENEIITTPIVIDTQATEIIEVEVTEAFQSSANGVTHDSLPDRNLSGAHVITAIEGLRDELDEIEALKVVYSNKKGNADYYEWADGNVAADNRTGLFVSLNDDGKIALCTGDNIFGVVVNEAAFVGGQADNTRGSNYGLVATTGRVLVRCTLNVAKDDYVVSNAYGVAKKANSNCGYRVAAIHSLGGSPYATINLTISGDKIHEIGTSVTNLNQRMTSAEANITAATNTANLAYQRAGEVVVISNELSNKVEGALDTVDKVVTDVSSLSEQAARTALISTQAKAIANSAINSATSMRNEAVANAKNALTETVRLRDEFGKMETQIEDIEDQVSIATHRINGDCQIVETMQGVDKQNHVVYYAQDTEKYHYYDYSIGDWRETDKPQDAGLTVAITGIRVKTDENSSSIDDLVSWQSGAKTAMARIERKADANGAYIQSTVANIDKYTVGPYSQTYGFTLEQATNVLENGTIYAPTTTKTETCPRVLNAIDVPTGDAEPDIRQVYCETDEDSTTIYYYWGFNNESNEYTWLATDDFDSICDVFEFAPGYLYVWNERLSGLYGWTPIGLVVTFSTTPPSVGDNLGYWYTDGDEVEDGYEPHTLYKWETYYDTAAEEEKHQWIAVATLSGNSFSRAVSSVRQSANSIESAVVGLRGEYAGIQQTVDADHARIDSIAAWPSDAGNTKYNMALIKQHSDGDSAHLALAAVRNVQQEDGTTTQEVTELGGATIVLADDEELGTYIQMDADTINFGESVTITNSTDTVLNVADNFIVDRQGNVEANSINANGGTIGDFDIDVAIYSGTNSLTSTEPGVYLGTDGVRQYHSENAQVTISNGVLNANGAIITGEINATRGSFTNCTIDDSCTIQGKLTIGNMPDGVATTDNVTTIVEGVINTVKINANQINVSDLSAFGATIGGWEINSNGILSGKYLNNGSVVTNNIINGMISATVNPYITINDTDTYIDFKHKSLVDSNKASFIRFVAGSTPMYYTNPEDSDPYVSLADNANFIVLEDGSVYANAIDIRGTISRATIKEGTIGGLTIQNNGISSGDGGVTIFQDNDGYGNIITHNLQVNNGLQINTISGTQPDSAYFRFNSKDMQSRSVTVSFTIEIVDAGSSGFFGMGWAPGQMTITATSTSTLYATKIFPIELTYGSKQTKKTLYVTIPHGKNSGSISTEYRVGCNDDYCRTTSIDSVTFTDYTGESTKAIAVYGSLLPEAHGSFNLGTMASAWGNVYASTAYYLGGSPIETSDKNKKNTINPIAESYSNLFDMLNPVTFKFNDGTSNRLHTGLIAQDVKSAIDACGIDSRDFAAYCEWKDDNGNDNSGLRYEEFIALCINEIQKLKKRVAELENN
jgi:hypothetical protein